MVDVSAPFEFLNSFSNSLRRLFLSYIRLIHFLSDFRIRHSLFCSFTHLPAGCFCFEWILREWHSYTELNSFDIKHYLPALTQPPNRDKTTGNPLIDPLQQGTAFWY
jgi:hypothetical protein